MKGTGRTGELMKELTILRQQLMEMKLSDELSKQVEVEYKLPKGKVEAEQRRLAELLGQLEELIKGNVGELEAINERLQHEINERHKMEAALKSELEILKDALGLSEERFLKIFRHCPALMLIVSIVEGRCIDVNNSWLKVMGYSREEVIGRTLLELNVWPDLQERSRIREMVLEKGSVHNVEIRYVTKHRQERIGLLSGDMVTINGEQCFLSVTSDITEYRQMEAEMLRLERLHLVGQIAAAIGHEVRNPMTSVRGFLQLLQEKKECREFHHYFEIMIGELDRANSIINEFLIMARNKSVKQTRQGLDLIVESIYPMIIADALNVNKNVKLKLGDIPDLPLDEKEIRQLILNLTRNGLEAMSPGGYLHIKTYFDGDEVVLSVQDQGTGIEKAILEKIGTPFFTTKDHGTGLGLATCYSIAARHNASISVETGPDGTTFLVHFKLLV